MGATQCFHYGSVVGRTVRCGLEGDVARLVCRHCDGVLPKRGARCRSCGWADDYDLGTGIRGLERERLIGIGFIAIALAVTCALALAMGW
jgi:hypothetical protein